jgi:hypothetical protein
MPTIITPPLAVAIEALVPVTLADNFEFAYGQLDHSTNPPAGDLRRSFLLASGPQHRLRIG